MTANYPGNVEHIVGEIKGPDTAGGFVRAKAARYDPATDRTRVEFTPIVLPAEVAELARVVPTDELTRWVQSLTPSVA